MHTPFQDDLALRNKPNLPGGLKYTNTHILTHTHSLSLPFFTNKGMSRFQGASQHENVKSLPSWCLVVQSIVSYFVYTVYIMLSFFILYFIRLQLLKTWHQQLLFGISNVSY